MIISTLVFSSSYIQLVQIDKRKKKLISNLSIPLEKNILDRGKIINDEFVTKACQKLFAGAKEKVEKIILVIEENGVTSKTLELPEMVDKDTDEAVNFAAEEFLPYSAQSMILDWKKVKNGGGNHILFFAIKKEIVDDYLEIMEHLKVEVLVLETTALCLERLAEKKEGVKLLIYIDNDDAVLTLTKNDRVVATSILKKNGSFGKNLLVTVQRMMNYYAKFKIELIQIGGMGVNKTILNELTRLKLPIAGFKPVYEIETNVFNNYLLAISAAMSEIELPEDENTINLLPEWYVDIYQTKKQKSFWKKVLSWWSIYSLVLVLGLGGLYGYFYYKEKEMVTAQNLVPQTKKELVTEVGKSNKYTKLVVDLATDDFFPIKTLGQISDSASEEITLMKSEFSTQKMTVDLAGIAKDRDSLLNFKKTLEELEFVDNVVLPVSSFNEQEDIPFQFNLKINKKIYEIEKN